MKSVGIANGQVVAVTEDLDHLARLIRQAEPDPTKTLCVEASCDYDEVHESRGWFRVVLTRYATIMKVNCR